MDCCFILAEELDRRQHCYEAFRLLAQIIREERRLPYFRHFTPEIEKLMREIVRLRLRPQVDDETWIECMETLLTLGFPPRDEAFWLRALAQGLAAVGDRAGAEHVLQTLKNSAAKSQPPKRLATKKTNVVKKTKKQKEVVK
jgi:hypothetical protein